VESPNELIRSIARLGVDFGANVQPGHVVLISTEPGQHEFARAVALAAYERGAKFVDLIVSDPQVKRARALHADPETLSYVPPWFGQRILGAGELHAARISLAGPSDPHALDGIDPELAGRDLLPRVPESLQVVNDGTTNWTIVPCPTTG